MKRVMDLSITLSGLLVSGLLHAAGGHHAVDDASILDPGRCHVETWYERGRGGRWLAHFGPACHLGGLEWGLALTHHDDGQGRATAWTPQVKWATETRIARLSVGIFAATTRGTAGEDASSYTLNLPLSLALTETAILHANLGRIWTRAELDRWTWGLALETALGRPFDAVIERFGAEGGDTHFQLGLRWHAVPESLSVDLGYAGERAGKRERWWTLGVTWEFDAFGRSRAQPPDAALRPVAGRG